MRLTRLKHRSILLLIALLVAITPAIILYTVFIFLVFTGDLERGEVTVIELVELYFIEFVLLAAFAYAMYRMMTIVVDKHLPESLDALEELAQDEGGQSASDDRNQEQ